MVLLSLRALLTLLNLSNPPSDSFMVFSQLSALLYRVRRASLNGSSHGSSCTTPGSISYELRDGSISSLPVPSFAGTRALVLFPFSMVICGVECSVVRGFVLGLEQVYCFLWRREGNSMVVCAREKCGEKMEGGMRGGW